MSIILGGVTLNSELLWTDRWNFSPVAQEVNRTIGGNVVTFSATLSQGQPITLIANERRGWFTKTMVDAVKALADVAGATYSFQFDTEIFTVQFRHEDDPAVEFEAFVPRGGDEPHDPTDNFAGTVRLLTVD